MDNEVRQELPGNSGPETLTLNDDDKIENDPVSQISFHGVSYSLCSMGGKSKRDSDDVEETVWHVSWD